MWYSSRPAPWNSSTLTVVWSEANETFDLDEKANEMKHAGFSLKYALQNNTGHDITISTDAVVMKRLAKASTLEDFSTVAKPYRAYFIPARQTAEFSIRLDYGCTEHDLDTGVVRSREPRVCFNEALADSESLVVFDHIQRVQINLPNPALKLK